MNLSTTPCRPTPGSEPDPEPEPAKAIRPTPAPVPPPEPAAPPAPTPPGRLPNAAAILGALGSISSLVTLAVTR